MVFTRKKRTALFRQQVEEEWSEYFWEFVLKYSDKLDWKRISWNPNISMRIIDKYSDKPWNWNWISDNPNITMEFIEKYSDKPWDWNDISNNPNITMKFIEKNLDKPWNWNGISYNPNITIDIIEKYSDKSWNWNAISLNKFNYEKELFTQKRMTEYLAAYRIQQYYLTAICNPYCSIGLNKVKRDYDKLFTEDGRIKRIKCY